MYFISRYTLSLIHISSFDPVRREVARMTLEKLIADGRIHPARIEETVEKCRRELDATMKREGCLLYTSVMGRFRIGEQKKPAFVHLTLRSGKGSKMPDRNRL